MQSYKKKSQTLCFLTFFIYFCKKIWEIMKRESNFEVLRTVAMFFIVVYHCLTHGVGWKYGFTMSSPTSFANLLFSDFLLVFSSIAVNLYVMISGYFLVDLDFKLSRVVRTWTNALFYSCIITVLFMAFQLVPFNITTLGKSFFPISTDAYWFVTQYIGLLILSPFLSLIARQISYHHYLFLLIGGAFICLSIIPDFPMGKRYYVAHGNSIWSFAYLFLVAGFIKHHVKRQSTTKILAMVVFVTILLFACEVFGGYQQGMLHLFWLNYNSLPFILSVLVFMLVRQMAVPENWFWNLLVKAAPYTFGVYLIHDHLLVRDWLWKTASLHSQCDKLAFPLIVIGLCLAIFAICACIDAIRKQLFTVCKIDNLIAKVDKWSVYS